MNTIFGWEIVNERVAPPKHEAEIRADVDTMKTRRKAG
jgi:hypothetical protein